MWALAFDYIHPGQKVLREQLFRIRTMKRNLIITLLILVGVFLLMDFVLMPWYVDHGATQQVPDVIDRTVGEASTILLAEGLEPVEGETKSDAKASPGTVIDQNPAVGSEVKFGRRVYLTVSGGELLVDVPSLRGLSTRDAKFALERSGLHLGELASSLSDTFFVNTIIEQNPPAGASVPKGAAVSVTVSLGKDPGLITVPDLTGKTVAEAGKILNAQGLTVGRITYQSGMNLIPNTIVDQYPGAGDPTDEEKAVDLFVAKGGEATKDPHPEF